MVRLSIDTLNIVLIEERCAMQLTISPIRFANCNCHGSSFCSDLLVKLPSIRLKQMAAKSDNEWMECGTLNIDNIDIDIRLPYLSNKTHLIQEEHNFLLKHDKATSRLYFLWSDQNTSTCYGSSRFFGVTDITGKVLMSDMECVLVVEHYGQDATKQPGIGQSIVHTARRALSVAQSPMIPKIALTDPATSPFHNISIRKYQEEYDDEDWSSD